MPSTAPQAAPDADDPRLPDKPVVPREPPDESALESLGRAVSAPLRDAADAKRPDAPAGSPGAGAGKAATP